MYYFNFILHMTFIGLYNKVQFDKDNKLINKPLNNYY